MISSCHIGLRWTSNTSGGAERVFAELAAGLPASGVTFLGAVPGPANLAERTGGLVHSFAPEDAGTVTRLRGVRSVLPKLLKSYKPDVLASHFAFYTAPILNELADRPFIMHFHGPWALESEVEGGSAPAISVKKAIEGAVYRRADKVIVLSQAFATLIHREYGVCQEKIHVIPGSVQLERFAPAISRMEARERLGWPKDRPILFAIRRLVHRMGLQQLMEALVRVRAQVPDVLLCIAGTGPLRSTLKSCVKDWDLIENVRFLGFLPDEVLPLAYRAADLSVVPTLALEGFGLVAAESLAAGTPVMVTPIGGLPEVVAELSPDLLFQSGSPADLAAGLTSALLGKIRLPSSEECRSYAEARFSRTLMTSRTAAIYRKVVS